MQQNENRSTDINACPLGEAQCPISDQIAALRSQVQVLSAQVRTDHLTGLFNVRHLQITLEQEIERTKRSYLPTTLIMFDVDHFKGFNDTYGHLVGDKVLIHLAKVIQASVRRLDIPCRYGGEEFAIILPSSPLMTGVQVANRLREAVEGSRLDHQGEDLKITISLGVETYDAKNNESPQSFIERADKLLYQAKAAGRNCVKYPDIERKDSSVSADEKDALFSIIGATSD